MHTQLSMLLTLTFWLAHAIQSTPFIFTCVANYTHSWHISAHCSLLLTSHLHLFVNLQLSGSLLWLQHATPEVVYYHQCMTPSVHDCLLFVCFDAYMYGGCQDLQFKGKYANQMLKWIRMMQCLMPCLHLKPSLFAPSHLQFPVKILANKRKWSSQWCV